MFVKVIFSFSRSLCPENFGSLTQLNITQYFLHLISTFRVNMYGDYIRIRTNAQLNL